MIGMIAAVSSNGVLGINDNIPWSYPADMKHFRETTKDSIVIMGRHTLQSMNGPLKNRRNVVISTLSAVMDQKPFEGCEVVKSMQEAIDLCKNETRNVWLIGGERIYEEGMNHVDEIHLTLIPDHLDYRHYRAYAKFPWINPAKFKLNDEIKMLTGVDKENNKYKLDVVKYVRI